jgi:hypothetical protein
MADLLVQTSLDPAFDAQTLFLFFTKQASLLRRSTVLSLPFQLVFYEQTKLQDEKGWW